MAHSRIPAPLSGLEVPGRLIRRVQSALDTGRGIAVLPLSSLLLDPFDDDLTFLGVDREYAAELYHRTAVVIRRCGAQSVGPFPLTKEGPVILYSDALGEKPIALLRALDRWVAPAETDPTMSHATKVVAAFRELLPAPRRPRRANSVQ
ncbi:hypothetical protein ACEZDB_35725 [Streptacidiphilus sp. N1-3]|uniref:Uncharacterized protein n=1 Tax=Streptacidiphilus alkalitolerans TaxID=3342712 RepID=A0ABV6XCL9_9ACTN